MTTSACRPTETHSPLRPAGPDGKTTLWVRSLDDARLRSIPGTEEVTQHFWSPDADWIAFFAQGKLKKVNLTTGTVETLCNATNPRGGSWGADNTIVLSPSSGQGLYVVSASGGEPRPLTTLDAGRAERSHRWPVFLPDGRHFLFVNWSGNPDLSGVYLGSVASSTTTRLAAGATNAAYVEPGYLLVRARRHLLYTTVRSPHAQSPRRGAGGARADPRRAGRGAGGFQHLNERRARLSIQGGVGVPAHMARSPGTPGERRGTNRAAH